MFQIEPPKPFQINQKEVICTHLGLQKGHFFIKGNHPKVIPMATLHQRKTLGLSFARAETIHGILEIHSDWNERTSLKTDPETHQKLLQEFREEELFVEGIHTNPIHISTPKGSILISRVQTLQVEYLGEGQSPSTFLGRAIQSTNPILKMGESYQFPRSAFLLAPCQPDYLTSYY